MKLKKIFLTIAIVAILSVTFVLAVSASEYDLIASGGENGEFVPMYQQVIFPSEENKNISFGFIVCESVYIRPVNFKNFVDLLLASNGDAQYSDFHYCLEVLYSHGKYPQGTDIFFQLWINATADCDEAYFNKLYYYTEITQEDLDVKDRQIANLAQANEAQEEFITEVVTEYNSLVNEFDELKEQNSKLQSDIENLTVDKESLAVQVDDLVKAKTEINSELMALDAKLEREVSKAYLQGVDDATSFSWTPIVVGLSVVSMLLTIVSLCIRGKKKKR